MFFDISNILTFTGPKLITSEFITEIKEQIIPVQVPRRGITILRKKMVAVPYHGVVMINGDYYVHPEFEKMLRKEIGAMFAKSIDHLYQEQLELMRDQQIPKMIWR